MFINPVFKSKPTLGYVANADINPGADRYQSIIGSNNDGAPPKFPIFDPQLPVY